MIISTNNKQKIIKKKKERKAYVNFKCKMDQNRKPRLEIRG